MASNPSEIHGVRTKFEPQNNDHFCGPACAIMVLDAVNTRPPDQETLFNEINSFQTKDRNRGHENWSSSPDGLKNALNSRSGSNHQFRVYASLRQSEIAKRLVCSISIFKAPCIALILSGIHWVVIYQYRKRGKEPTSFDDFLVRDILGFYKRDPLQNVPSEGFIDYMDWITGDQLPAERGLWKDKFVAICDPEPDNNKKNKKMPSDKKKTFDTKSSSPVSLPGPGASDKQDNTQNLYKSAKPVLKIPDLKATVSKDVDPKKPASKGVDPKKPVSKDANLKKPVSKGVDPEKPPITRNIKPGQDQKLINENTAKAYAMWHLEKDGFYDPKKFSRMMKNHNAGEPVLVHNLDTGDFFYIIPLMENKKLVSGMMRIDAKDARLQEAVFAMDINKPFTFAKLSDKEIKDLLEAEYGKPKKSKPISILPILVWKRCIQSMSRFLPFYKVIMGKKTVYVRIDGNVYSGLTKRRNR